MTKAIFNADDFGYSRAVNFGIMDCYKYGILTSTTLMTNMPGLEHAVELAKADPGLGVGVHMTLTCGKPLKREKSTLTDESGNFRKQGFYLKEFEIDLDELYEEWDAQIRKFLDSDLTPTHLDSHHHAHTFGNNMQVAVDLAKKYSLPLRNNDGMLACHPEIKHTEAFIDDLDFPAFAEEKGWSESRVLEFLDQKYDEIAGCSTVEIMCHPAYICTELLKGSSFNVQRCSEVDMLIDSAFAKRIKASEEIKLVTYREI